MEGRRMKSVGSAVLRVGCGGKVAQSLRDDIDYELGNEEMEVVAVVSGGFTDGFDFGTMNRDRGPCHSFVIYVAPMTCRQYCKSPCVRTCTLRDELHEKTRTRTWKQDEVEMKLKPRQAETLDIRKVEPAKQRLHEI